MSDTVMYTFPQWSWDLVEERIAQANARLEKAGIAERFEYVWAAEPRVRPSSKGKHLEKDLFLNAFSLSHNDWEFLAFIGTLPSGDLIVKSHTELNGWAPQENTCEHCSRKQARIKSYLARNMVTGETIQLGSTCVSLYTGVEPKGLWALTFDLSELESSPDGDYDEIPFTYRVFTVEDVIALALKETEGGIKYISRAKAAEWDTISTADAILGALTDRKFTLTKDLLTPDVDSVITYARALEPTTDYNRNVTLYAQQPWVPGTGISTLASIVVSWARHTQRETQKNTPKAQGFLGTIGDKIENLTVTVTNIVAFDGYYGTQRIATFTSNTNQLIWKTNTHPDFTIGDTLTLIRGTVKDHTTYNGNDQTVLSRPRFTNAA